MSSVTRFLRQIPTGLNYVNADPDTALDFVPTSGNYVGNYPPGYMVVGTQTGLSLALATALGQNSGQLIIRDMGKTIFAPYAVNGTVANGNSGNFASYGYFRQYQALMVNPISTTQGFLGGVNGNTFGVVGPAPATVPGTSTYVTFYLPVSVQGVGSSAGLPSAAPINGGQM
jgi:hypothetical protein